MTASSTKIAARMIALILLIAGCGPGASDDEVEFRVPVAVQEVALGTVEDTIVTTGTLRAAELVTLTVESVGVLEIGRSSSGRQLAEGDQVKSGDVIARITGEDVRLAARTAATRQRFEAAERDLEATVQLHRQGLITETQLETAETAYEEARLEFDRSRHTEKRNNLVTPIDGVILRLARDAQGQPIASGQLVAPGQAIAQVAPTRMLVADVDVVGPDVARIHVGQTARVRHLAWPDHSFGGSVIRLAPTIDPVTRALRSEVEVANTDGLLRPGMFVEVAVVGELRENVPVVPREAITDRGGKRVVFVLTGQRVARRDVALGLGDDERVEIRDGVSEGERVVVRGLETLTDQTRVRVTGGDA
jgi:membrane fusion protein (multidrug efflux system)